MSTKTALKKAIKITGGKSVLANNLGIAYQSINRWMQENRMPDSEYSCRSNHAEKIEKLTDGKVTVAMVLGHIPTCIKIKG